MSRGRGARRGRGPNRAIRPIVEALDGRLLLSGVSAVPVGGKLGPFIAPGAIRPRIQQAPVRVDASPAVTRYLVQLLGPGDMEPIRAQAAVRGAASHASLYRAALAQPLVNAVLGALDTYALLESPAVQELVGFDVPPDEPPADGVAPPVTFLVEEANILARTPIEATVAIPPVAGRAGFVVTVPIGNLRLAGEGLFQVEVPAELIPGADAPAPPAETVGTGAFADVYRATGPVLTEALRTGLHARGPNTPPVVRGLRLVRAFGDPRIVPHGTQANYLRLLRVAVERDAFVPTASQRQRIADGIEAFLDEVARLAEAGVFTPSVPPPTAPNPLAGARLGGTLQVTSGAVRDLMTGVSPGQTGLQLRGGSLNFPGRIDAGFVIAADGDYGLILTARGPLQEAPAGFSTGLIGGDLRVGLSNARSLTELNGLRVEEGTSLGSVASGEITASRTPLDGRHLVTLGAAAGFGAGLDFGTAVSYTLVIPLGNLNALLPQYPGP